MMWMALLGLGLVAGFVLLIDDDDDDTSSNSGGGSDTDNGGGEDIDPFIGASGDDEINGDSDDNTILGKNGDDELTGRAGDDRVFGDGGQDSVDGGFGDDSVFGGNGDDLVLGGNGDDLSRGGRDDDVLVDTTGSDVFFGDGDNDLIIASGTMDADASEAFLANPDPDNGIANLLDQLQIDFSEDTDGRGDAIFAGSGDDTVVFGEDDTVTGGEGADTLLTASWLEGESAATVTDFDTEEDRLLYAYDPADGEPEMTMELVENEDGTSDALISANGSAVMRIEDQDETFDLAEHLLLINGVRSA